MASSLRCGFFKALLVLGILLLCATQVHADMWTYVDARGVKHFASSQLDTRYKLMFHGMPASDIMGQPDSGTFTAVARYAPISAVGRSVASLELSPGFMAVKPLVRTAADANQLDMALLQAVIAAESGFDSSA
ncbi:MAG: DUF4124 domain-containing protein, partial [Burkholderiales bacterium]